MTKKQFIRDYLHFTHKERRAIIVLVIILVALFLSPHFFPKVVPMVSLNKDTSWMVTPKKVPYQKRTYEKERVKYIYYNSFYHQNKRNYNAPVYEKRKIAEYNSIRNSNYTSIYRKAERKLSMIDINKADTLVFMDLPGIGNKLAARIIAFREKLGGFYSIDQVRELYGLTDSVFQKIRSYLFLTDSSIRKLNINTATKDELKIHPYIHWQIANILIAYRNEHGKFMEIEDLKKIPLITPEIFEKLRHYIVL